ncbi:hypothetical protein F2P44_01955 [Massilia sp. CCM 8695]|uniref:Phasin domain-containing protein n=2 Tax=Massilia TaxID=149698 RepID=A0ABX0MYE4_9BURK|nr:hypothetical protein [Massilia frigida]NHZ78063.1 hypothetical protein [Massilia frigida]
MFSSSDLLFRSMRELFDTQAGMYQRSVHAAMDAGVSAAEVNVDSIRTLLATATVATRQWQCVGGASNWLTPVPRDAWQFAIFGRPLLAAPPAGAQPGTATGT